MIEFLKIILSTQAVTGASCLTFIFVFKKEIKSYIDRIAKVKTPGGGEVSTPQQDKKTEKEFIDNSAPLDPAKEDEKIPSTLNDTELEQVKDLLSAERTRAYIWEYNYLNYFLVPTTQHILDWLSACTTPVSTSLFHTFWTPIVSKPTERDTILSVLENHYLIIIENDLIAVSPKGEEYIGFRGKMPE